MPSRPWPYSPQYKSNVGEGHGRPPPAFGAPTLVWHLGVWQAESLPKKRVASTDRTNIASLRQKTRENIDERNAHFFAAVSEYLKLLQEGGRVLDESQPLEFDAVRAAAEDESYQFCRFEPQSIAFTLWWQDGAGAGTPNRRQNRPSSHDLRVRIVAQSNFEHATISFFIDVGKPWNAKRVFSLEDAVGDRRQRIFAFIEHIRRVSEGQIARARVDGDLVPEQLEGAEDAALLLEGANYLYDGVWRELFAGFGLPWPLHWKGKHEDDKVEIFADLRGLIHSLDGVEATPRNARRAERTQGLREALKLPRLPTVGKAGSATVGIGRFPTFDRRAGEPNTVLKAYWPFIRRMAPGADQRDFIGCGILDWRCLIVSPLGSHVEATTRDEGEDPGASLGHLPELPGTLEPKPILYLLLTKHEPLRQQIGRFVERINAVTTMRLFALKHWADIRNAGIHLRVLGRELDDVLTGWSESRHSIDIAADRARTRRTFSLFKRSDHRFPSKRDQDINDERLRQL